MRGHRKVYGSVTEPTLSRTVWLIDNDFTCQPSLEPSLGHAGCTRPKRES